MSQHSLALFDIDQTIYRGYAADIFVKIQSFRTSFKVGAIGDEESMAESMRVWAEALKGQRYEDILILTKEILRHKSDMYFSFVKPTLSLLHETHEIFFVTSEPQFIAQAVQETWGGNGYFSSEFEVLNGIFTGKVVNFLANGIKKAEHVELLIFKYGKKNSFALGDNVGDIEMLAMVEHAFCMSLNNEMRSKAHGCGWIVVDEGTVFESVKKVVDHNDRTNTPDELLDLVDEYDEIIGHVLKGIANRSPEMLHREVAVLIYDDQNRILVQQRSFKKKVNPGYWTVSSMGHIKQGQTADNAAHDELREELGFDTDLRFFDKELVRLENETFFEHWFVGRYSGEKIVIDTDEVEKVMFLSEDEFEKSQRDGSLLIDGSSIGAFIKFWEGHLDTYKL